MSVETLLLTFDELMDHLKSNHQIELNVDLVIDYEGSYPKPRDYAKTTGECIYLSPKILIASRDRIEGLLRHELGHVLLMQVGDYDHSEREADLVAEQFLGKFIYYDDEDVQTVALGTRPRPSHLPM